MEQLALPADTESLISEWISGKTNLKYSLELSGKSGAELLAGAAGHADFTAPNGISSALALESRPTRFQGLQGSCELAHQVLKLSASKFKAENRIYVLSGTISLAEKQAKLKVSNSVTQWEITGNLEKPNVAAQRLTAEKTGSSVNTR